MKSKKLLTLVLGSALSAGVAMASDGSSAKCGAGKCGGEKAEKKAEKSKCGSKKAEKSKCGGKKEVKAKCGSKKDDSAKCGSMK